ncbi:MAG: hypothetical protein M1826_005708 [Phylliscum demangeonii]|nr:MAG: hypothetical protein M1826_005708 [Phylliscum demangeonii]
MATPAKKAGKTGAKTTPTQKMPAKALPLKTATIKETPGKKTATAAKTALKDSALHFSRHLHFSSLMTASRTTVAASGNPLQRVRDETHAILLGGVLGEMGRIERRRLRSVTIST